VRLSLAFSWARNVLKAHTRAVQLRRDQTKPDRYQFTRNLKIFDGVRATSLIYICWCLTYLMAEYGVIQNPQYIDETKGKFWFTFVTGGFFSVSIMMFVTGFLFTYSFLSEQECMSPKKVGLYYAKRVFKIMPFNIFAILFTVYFIPTLGNGPFYAQIIKAVEPCHKYWWTNVIYINNFYPANYEDKCLPQTWFVACAVQMSLVVPLLVAVYKASSKVSRILLAVLFITFMGLNFGLAYDLNEGMYPFNYDSVAHKFNPSFYNDLFMMPYY
jgi:peptidoglycan/LPS O-acetylase OafA/YrhL